MEFDRDGPVLWSANFVLDWHEVNAMSGAMLIRIRFHQGQNWSIQPGRILRDGDRTIWGQVEGYKLGERKHLDQVTLRVIPRAGSAVKEQEDNWTITTFMVDKPVAATNPICLGCKHHHGHTHNDILLVCGMHPYGPAGDECGDWEETEIPY
jgi:hypothetical protein